MPLLSIINPIHKTPGGRPLPKLRFAEAESAVLQCLWQQGKVNGKVTRLAGADASQAAVLTALQGSHRLLHFTGHGGHNSQQPEQSALALAGNDCLTTREISQNLPLGRYQLVCLAACETGLTGQPTKLDTDYVGLVSAFLQANTTVVLSTLWEVEDDAHAWLTLRFYQTLIRGVPPAVALQLAQHWLRTITPRDLRTWLSHLCQLPGMDTLAGKDYLQARARNLANDSSTMDSSQPCYPDPYYWAAFILAGAVTR